MGNILSHNRDKRKIIQLLAIIMKNLDNASDYRHNLKHWFKFKKDKDLSESIDTHIISAQLALHKLILRIEKD